VFPPKEHARGHSSVLGLSQVGRDEQLVEESRETELEEERNRRNGSEQGWPKETRGVGRARRMTSKVSDFQHQRLN